MRPTFWLMIPTPSLQVLHISNILTSLLIFVNISTPWYVDGRLFQLFETRWCPDQPSDQLRSGLKQNKVISQVVTMQPGYIWQSRYKNVGFTKHVAVFMDQVEFWYPLPTLTQFVKREQLTLMQCVTFHWQHSGLLTFAHTPAKRFVWIVWK